ncbi:MAG TPA: site-specific DNA-methyltransferase [Oligoflexus sp.]|uniref:DNA-methyltransferase n=1 Tax=Oligoflexus sp. TaxID=1971216 RepID=UPI002D6B377F|nr:site-specific DNA-methyltransferase [Oligoflexus sp.]HYX39990.1 site-specific DNA-methyltransferase [Oligoflexus sp.]
MSLTLHCGDCLKVLPTLESESVDMVLTSPPYDDLRKYNGYTFNFEGIASDLERVLKPGGVIVWIVADATVKGSESGSSFRQALHFMSLGLNLHDTMIWNKGGFSDVGSLQTRYAPVFEYMFVFSKGKPKSFNPIKDRPNKWAGTKNHGNIRLPDGTMRAKSNARVLPDFGHRFNVWDISPHRQRGADKHPAPFPIKLAHDHILSWSNPGDTILDPMMGSGTTGQAAKDLERNFIGIEISEEYFKLSRQRLGVA